MRCETGAAEAAKFIRENGVTLEEVAKECQRLDAERQARKEAKEPQWLVSREVMGKLRISRSTLWRLIRDGHLKASKISEARCGKVLVSQASLDAFLESRRIGGDKE